MKKYREAFMTEIRRDHRRRIMQEGKAKIKAKAETKKTSGMDEIIDEDLAKELSQYENFLNQAISDQDQINLKVAIIKLASILVGEVYSIGPELANTKIMDLIFCCFDLNVYSDFDLVSSLLTIVGSAAEDWWVSHTFLNENFEKFFPNK